MKCLSRSAKSRSRKRRSARVAELADVSDTGPETQLARRQVNKVTRSSVVAAAELVLKEKPSQDVEASDIVRWTARG